MNEIAKQAAAWAARGAELAGLLALGEAAADRVGRARPWLRVLTWHRVADPASDPDLHPGLASATPAGFDVQLAWLARRFAVVSLADVLEARRGGRPLPRRALLLTFDDAYADFAEHAWPALRRRGLPAALFVPTAYPDQPGRAFWWDRLWSALARTRLGELRTREGSLRLDAPAERTRSFKRLRSRVKALGHDEAMAFVDEVCAELGAAPAASRVLGWSALRRLAREGATLLPHSRSHPLLHRIDGDRVREEVTGSLADLRREIGPTPAVLAYPSGGYDASVVRRLREEGFELAFTTENGINDLSSADPLRLRRVSVTLRTGRPVLRTRLLPWPRLRDDLTARDALRAAPAHASSR
jgi:peptidoglycan/xylan/chitin deacetylase (PgdA/CDA1 family)